MLTGSALTYAVIGRVLERVLIVVGGLLAVYFGFRLFERVPQGSSDLSAGIKGWSIQARRFAPGTLFCAFGIAALAHSALNPLAYSSLMRGQGARAEGTSGNKALDPSLIAEDQFQYGGSAMPNLIDKTDAYRSVLAINNLRALDLRIRPQLAPSDRPRFAVALEQLTAHRASLIDGLFGEGAVADWERLQPQVAASGQPPSNVNSREARHYKEVSELLSEELKP